MFPLAEMLRFLKSRFEDPIELLFRLILGGVFLFSGVMKAINPIEFQQSVRAYELINDPWPGVVALGLPWLEIFCALAVLLRVLYSGGLVLISGMLAVFIPAIISVWVRGLNIECGCFGKAVPVDSYAIHILINTSLLLIGIGLLMYERKCSRPAAEEEARQQA